MTITIDGLTKRQVTICERLWRCQTEEAVEKYISMLPRHERSIARSLKQMMILQALDNDPDSDAITIADDAITKAMGG